MKKYDEDYAEKLADRLIKMAAGLEKQALECMADGSERLKTARGNVLSVEQAVNRARGIRDAIELILDDQS